MALAPAPSLWNVVVPAEVSVWGLGLTVATATAYMVGVRRVAAKGRTWPRTRTLAFQGGLAVIAFAAFGGLARYDDVLFSAHTVQHVLLGMVGPVFLALGAPLTLGLQALRPQRRRALLRLLDNPVVRFATHPVTAWLLFTVTLFVLYFSPLYSLSLSNAWVHAGVHAHFVLVGTLFALAVVGLDPHPVRLPHPARMLLVALTVPVHAFLGVALLSMRSIIGGDVYASEPRPLWCGPLLTDQRNGASILWVLGELFGLAVAAIVAVQWMRHSEREARRHDQLLDRAMA